MKYNIILIATFAITTGLFAGTSFHAPSGAGIKLLYYQNHGWQDSTSWLQIDVPTGLTPIQRVPTEQDDVVFSNVISGLTMVNFTMDSMNIGGVTTSEFECRSLHVSGMHLSFATSTLIDVGTYIYVQTNNGGNVVIDSGAVFEHGLFTLRGGNTSVVDLGVYNSTVEEYFSHAVWCFINGEDYSRINFVNSYFSGNGFSAGAHSRLYGSNSTFNTYAFTFGDNSADTIINCKIGNVNGGDIYSLNVSFGKNSTLVSDSNSIFAAFDTYIYTSGARLKADILPGPVAYHINLKFTQEDTTHALPNIIDGNISLADEEDMGLAIENELWLSGNLNGYSQFISSVYDSTKIFVNGIQQFVIGGITNFNNSTTVSNCQSGFCHYKLVLFGNKNSNISWPAGFPIDTLVIAKSNCAKVTVANPLYVASETRIDSGQLALYPNAGVPYKFVSGGNVYISNGGGLFLRRDSLGNVANMAVQGTIIDQNPSSDSACQGLSNPYGGLITFFSGPLPITLIDFSAKPLSQSVLLNWIMNNQSGAHVFAIEKSFNGSQFTKIGEVNALQTNAGYEYEFTDNGAMADIIYYRLKITEIDGAISYSRIIRINETIPRIGIYPNPITDHFLIKNLPVASQLQFSILDAKGVIVKETTIYTTSSSLNVRTSNLGRGTYILLLRGAKIASTFKLIKL